MSETCETSIRGILNSIDGLSSTVGQLFILLMAKYFEWRTIALICLTIPMVTMIGVVFVSVFYSKILIRF